MGSETERHDCMLCRTGRLLPNLPVCRDCYQHFAGARLDDALRVLGGLFRRMEGLVDDALYLPGPVTFLALSPDSAAREVDRLRLVLQPFARAARSALGMVPDNHFVTICVERADLQRLLEVYDQPGTSAGRSPAEGEGAEGLRFDFGGERPATGTDALADALALDHDGSTYRDAHASVIGENPEAVRTVLDDMKRAIETGPRISHPADADPSMLTPEDFGPPVPEAPHGTTPESPDLREGDARRETEAEDKDERKETGDA